MKLSELKAIAEARTEGEWVFRAPDLVFDGWVVDQKDGPFVCETGQFKYDAEFIATMANHADALLEVVEAVKTALELHGDCTQCRFREVLAKLESVK